MNISVQAKCRAGRLLLSHDMDEMMRVHSSGYWICKYTLEKSAGINVKIMQMGANKHV